MAKEWTFKVFISSTKVNVFDKWLNALPIKARAKIKRRIEYLEITKIWDKRYFKKVSGYKDLYEIRIICNNIQYRPIGCLGPKGREFIILIGVIKKGKKLNPSNAFDTAYNRSILINMEEHINDY